MTSPIYRDGSAYGLSTELSFDSTQGQTLLAGRRTLVTITGGPEGVALKRIRSIQDAIDCNGILLYQQDNPARWQFFVGKSFQEALEKRLFGKVTRMRNGADRAGDSVYAVPYKPWGGEYRQVNPDNSKIRYKRTWGGGDIWPVVVEANYFPEGHPVVALGLISTATEGYGVSVKLSDSLGEWTEAPVGYNDGALAYMTTSVGVDKTFKHYFDRVLSTALARVPSDARGYYSSSYEAAMAKYGRAKEQPTIGISTYWLSGQLMPSVQPKLHIREFDLIDWFGANPTGLNLTLSLPSAEYSPAPPSGGNYPINEKKMGKVRMVFLPGTWYPSETTTLPLMCFFGNYCRFEEQAPLVGEVAGLKVGELRDGHVLLRALGSNPQRFALETARQKSLSELVDQQLFKSLYNRGDNPSDLTDLGASEPGPDGSAVVSGDPKVALGNAQARFDQYQNDWRRLESIRTVYNRSTLPEMLNEFAQIWDAEARAKAGV